MQKLDGPQGCTGKRQRALTPPEELDGSLTAAVTIFHITGIIPQVVLLQGVNSQGNGHFLLTQMLLDNPARQTNQKLTQPFFFAAPVLEPELIFFFASSSDLC